MPGAVGQRDVGFDQVVRRHGIYRPVDVGQLNLAIGGVRVDVGRDPRQSDRTVAGRGLDRCCQIRCGDLTIGSGDFRHHGGDDQLAIRSAS